ncbi:MAG: hypothetical protein MI861_28300, partial [Pirellulales bacterium]|nr:hypothetical protein [Pirellulales bacterium]
MTGTDAATKSRRPGRLSRFLVAALFVFAACVVVRSLAPQTIGETVRRKLEQQLQQHYSNLSVSIGRGRYDPKVGIILDDLRIAQPASSAFQFRSQEIIHIGRVIAFADIEPEKLLEQEVPLTTRRLVLQDVQVNAWLDRNGQPCLTKLMPFPVLGPAAPAIQLHNARIRLLGDKRQDRPIEIALANGLLQNRVNVSGQVEKTLKLKGRADFADEILLQCDMANGNKDLRAKVVDAHLSRELFERLPSQWSRLIGQVRELDCICDAELSLFQSGQGELNYRLRTTVHEGRFNHPELPKPITQLRGVLVAEPDGIRIEHSQGMLGDSIVRVSGDVSGCQWPADVQLQVVARGLLLDDQLAAAIPSSLRAGWNRLQPLGRIDVDADVHCVDARWQTEATLICKGVDIRFDKFPYPVQQLVGRIDVRNGRIRSESLNGRIGGHRMQCAFEMPSRPEVVGEKSFVIATDGPVPIDNTLMSALSPRGVPTTKLQSFVQSLRPRGSLHLATAMFATDIQGRTTRKIDLRIIDGHLRYKKFAYPLYHVEGQVHIENDLVKLIGFRGTNANAGTILCDGTYRMPAKKIAANGYHLSDRSAAQPTDSELWLNFRASNVPMDESLRSSLPPPA